MLKIVLDTPYGGRKAQGLLLRFSLQTRRISGPMSPSEEFQHGIFVANALERVNASSSARTGKIALKGRKIIETPNFLAITSRGAVPHITPDILSEHTSIGGVHMALEDFVEKATNGTPPIMNCPPGKSTALHTFTALPTSLITLLAPRRTPAVPAPTGNTDHSIWLFTSVGFRPLSKSSYIEYAQKVRPDIVIGLADISYGTRPGTKRIERMGNRTSRWLDSMLSDIERPGKDGSPAVFAPVLSVDFHSQSEYLHHIADDLADSISGLAFYSSSLLPDIPATTSLSRLPRLSLDEPSSPHHILRQVSLGMDLFTIPFISFATDSGLALTFQLPQSSLDISEPTEANGLTRNRSLAIDLSSPSHATSTLPLMPNCSCYACTAHHRAYLTHLLSAHEMLGWVLLQIHNHHVLSTFFAAIRDSIEAGTFEESKDMFERMYESVLPEGTGQRPRARGYHFKSEGPGEEKKNKPAWGALGNGDGNLEAGGGETPGMVPEGMAGELEGKGFAEAVDS